MENNEKPRLRINCFHFYLSTNYCFLFVFSPSSPRVITVLLLPELKQYKIGLNRIKKKKEKIHPLGLFPSPQHSSMLSIRMAIGEKTKIIQNRV